MADTLNEVTITLSANTVTIILQALEAGPYRQVKPAIDEITLQIQMDAKRQFPVIGNQAQDKPEVKE